MIKSQALSGQACGCLHRWRMRMWHVLTTTSQVRRNRFGAPFGPSNGGEGPSVGLFRCQRHQAVCLEQGAIITFGGLTPTDQTHDQPEPNRMNLQREIGKPD